MNWFRRPITALQMANIELEETRQALLEMCRKREYYIAMEDMLIRRISRLQDSIANLGPDGGKDVL